MPTPEPGAVVARIDLTEPRADAFATVSDWLAAEQRRRQSRTALALGALDAIEAMLMERPAISHVARETVATRALDLWCRLGPESMAHLGRDGR